MTVLKVKQEAWVTGGSQGWLGFGLLRNYVNSRGRKQGSVKLVRKAFAEEQTSGEAALIVLVFDSSLTDLLKLFLSSLTMQQKNYLANYTVMSFIS